MRVEACIFMLIMRFKIHNYPYTFFSVDLILTKIFKSLSVCFLINDNCLKNISLFFFGTVGSVGNAVDKDKRNQCRYCRHENALEQE